MYSSLLFLRRRDEVMKLFRKARETLPETQSQNRIEEVFVAGTDDLGARKSFYELLLASDVFVEGTASEKSRDAAGGFHVVGVDPGLTVESFGPPGQQFIVFYTSLSRMDGQLATLGRRRGQRYVRVNARTLFDGFPLADFVMNVNPMELAKRFRRDEVRRLLDGSLLGRPVSRPPSETDDDLFIRGASSPPQELLSKLTRGLDRIGVVERAFVAEAYKPSMGDSPQYLVVVKFHEGSSAALDDFMEKLKPVLDAAEMSHSVLFGDWKSNKHMIPEGTEPFYIRQEP